MEQEKMFRTMPEDLYGRLDLKKIRCEYCKQRKITSAESPFKRTYKMKGSKVKMFCSYECMRKNDLKQMNEDMKRIVSCPKILYADNELDYVNAYYHPTEKKTMHEFATQYGSDYKMFWKYNVVDGFHVIDALQMSAKKEE